MVIKPGFILYRSQSPLTSDTFTTPHPHRIRKHRLRLHSIDLNKFTTSELQRTHFLNIKLTISNDIKRFRYLAKHLTSSKKLVLEIDIKGFESFHFKKAEKIKQLLKQLFTGAKRVKDMQITLADPYCIIIKDIPRLAQLAKLHIILSKITPHDEISPFSTTLCSSRVKTSLAKLHSLHLAYTLREHAYHDTPEFLRVTQIIAEINSSLQIVYPQIKSTLRFFAFTYASTVPLLIEALNNSPHITFFGTRLNPTNDYTLLLEKLETLNYLSTLQLSIGAYNLNLSRVHRSWEKFGDHLVRLKPLRELHLRLQSTREPKIFLEKLSFLSRLQDLSLDLNLASMDKETINLLIESIASLSHLQSFKISLLPPHINPYTLDYQVLDLFKDLGKFKYLRVLHISMSNFGQYLDNNTLFAIIDAIENLVELRAFKFDAQRSLIDDKGLFKLAKTVPKLIHLEDIKINLAFRVKKENETLIALLKALSVLKHLARIDLSISCSEINLATYETVVLLLNRLRNLSSFNLELMLVNKNPDVKAKFKALFEDQYQYAKFFGFLCE